MSEDTSAFKKYLSTFNGLTSNQIENIVQASTQRTIKKNDFVIRELETSREVGFVVEGILRTYLHSEKSGQITYCFTFPNQLVTAYSSFITRKPTKENIQAITNVRLLTVPIRNFSEKNTGLTLFLKQIAEQQYVELENRVVQLLIKTATQRYTELIDTHPEFIEQIPLQFLASYLGVTQRHLSRIRNLMRA